MSWPSGALIAILLLLVIDVNASPLFSPGNVQLRQDLELLNDSGTMSVPLTAWPVSVADVANALAMIDAKSASPDVRAALDRVAQSVLPLDQRHIVTAAYSLAATVNPRFIRTFENTPRDEGEIAGSISWMGDRFSVHLQAAGIANPFDEDEVRPDGSYVGAALGNWLVTAGWQDRWWGPGRDGSLILSTNARPTPGLAVQRQVSTPFSSKWLSWIGPWTLTSYLTELDDDRAIRKARLFGVRGSFRPPRTGLEIGISRTAQWCGDGRPCSLSTFGDLLLGNDNRGVNVDPDDEPGNQLGGIDIRWHLPKKLPVALYMQWIGEDGRGGGGAIGAWLRQLGAEYWGTIGDWSHRSHFEISDTSCRQGGFGFSDPVPDCGYEHSIYRTGYRYKGRSIGHSQDGDGLSYSLGSTLVQSGGHSWNVSLRYMEINRTGAPGGRHTLSSGPINIIDLQVSHRRNTAFGQLYFGLNVSDADGPHAHHVASDIAGFVQWSSR